MHMHLLTSKYASAFEGHALVVDGVNHVHLRGMHDGVNGIDGTHLRGASVVSIVHI